MADIYLMVKTEWLHLILEKNKDFSAFISPIQHTTGMSSQCNNARKGNKSHTD